MPRAQERQTVYIVDDDDSVRRALSRLLRSAGLDAQSFCSGEELLAGLPPEAHGCLLMDIQMPGLTGHEVQRRLRACGARVSVIAVSAQDDSATRQRARELGAVAFFRKPVDDQALLDAIHWASDNLSRSTAGDALKPQ
jgi:FixJ family two-component response regulator